MSRTRDAAVRLGVELPKLSDPATAAADLEAWKNGALKEAWRAQSRRLHPDRAPEEDREEATRAFAALSDAHDRLRSITVKIVGRKAAPATPETAFTDEEVLSPDGEEADEDGERLGVWQEGNQWVRRWKDERGVVHAQSHVGGPPVGGFGGGAHRAMLSAAVADAVAEAVFTGLRSGGVVNGQGDVNGPARFRTVGGSGGYRVVGRGW